MHLAGLSAPVFVRRDAHGVPHIEASSEMICSWLRDT